MAVRTCSSRAQHTCPSWTRCPVVTPVTFKEEARQNECLMLLRFQRMLLNRLFLPCCSPQTFPFLPKIASRELANPISPFFPPVQPHGGLLQDEQLQLTHGALEAVRPKNSQLPGEQESYFRASE